MSGLLHIIQHSLGVDGYGRGNQYREHFCAGPGHTEYATCCEAVERGLMVRRDGLSVVGGTMFYVTDAGRQWMAENSPKPSKLTRSQERYRRYLDADCGMSFGEWLQLRRAA